MLPGANTKLSTPSVSALLPLWFFPGAWRLSRPEERTRRIPGPGRTRRIPGPGRIRRILPGLPGKARTAFPRSLLKVMAPQILRMKERIIPESKEREIAPEKIPPRMRETMRRPPGRRIQVTPERNLFAPSRNINL
jgi:hypothetical protein